MDSNDDDQPFTMGEESSPNNNVGTFMASDGSENVKSKRISNDGDAEGGSGDYRNQYRRGNHEGGDDEEYDEAENDD